MSELYVIFPIYYIYFDNASNEDLIFSFTGGNDDQRMDEVSAEQGKKKFSL